MKLVKLKRGEMMSNKLDGINKMITTKHKQMDDLYDEKQVG